MCVLSASSNKFRQKYIFLSLFLSLHHHCDIFCIIKIRIFSHKLSFTLPLSIVNWLYTPICHKEDSVRMSMCVCAKLSDIIEESFAFRSRRSWSISIVNVANVELDVARRSRDRFPPWRKASEPWYVCQRVNYTSITTCRATCFLVFAGTTLLANHSCESPRVQNCPCKLI